MGKKDNEKKSIRVEYKILGFVLIFILLSTGYRFIKEYLLEHPIEKKQTYSQPKAEQNKSQAQSTNQNNSQNKEQEKAKNISEAVSQERPIVLEMSENPLMNIPEYNSFVMENPDIRNLEKATEVENPTIWIYMDNDGIDKSEEAKMYCQTLHEKGIKALRVEIYDAKQRARGKIVQIGEYRCF